MRLLLLSSFAVMPTPLWALSEGPLTFDEAQGMYAGCLAEKMLRSRQWNGSTIVPLNKARKLCSFERRILLERASKALQFKETRQPANIVVQSVEATILERAREESGGV